MARVLVFVYGTLKSGQPNHGVLRDSAHGQAALRGPGRTRERFPLVIAGPHNVPFLLRRPGCGHRVRGEVYAVDGALLSFLDDFEDCPHMYQRTPAAVVLDGDGGEEGRTVECWLYSTESFPPEWARLPHLEDYDSQGAHGLRYNPRENR
ncbi:gamma-glutamylaminecyclotransferase isoform X2 [Erinaceus europaeus]|nr:gamma-glutamylaminecyclotransferase isoform X2 [Erinaceus europaeus]XP_060047811.1 gamma-glutamylaminecyclotransferase isoform X2 [Erinaceus europaeus]